MKIIKKSRQNLAQLTEEILTPLGFSRRGTCFLREAPECIQIVQLQGSRYNTGTYVNQMVWFKHFGSSAPLPIGSDFHFSTRMESASATEEPHWITVLDASGEPIDRSHWKDQLAILFQSQIPVFDLLQTLSSARDNYQAKRVDGFFVYKALHGGA